MDGDDAGVIDFSGDAGFSNEPLAELRAFLAGCACIDADDFNRDGTANGGIAGVIDDAHGSAAELAQNFVSADARRIHWSSNPT